MKGDGPYQLAPKFSHLEVTEEVWRGLSPKERVARIASEDHAGVSAYEVCDTQVAESRQHDTCETSSCVENLCSLLVDFNASGLPQTLKATWNNADSILKKGGVTKVSGAVSTFAVISLTNPARPRIVNKEKGEYGATVTALNSRRFAPMSLLWPVLKIFSKILFLSGFLTIESRSSLNFFRFNFRNCLSCVYNCDDHSLIRFSLSNVEKEKNK